MGRGDTWLNALLGALVTIVLSVTVFSPVLGGAVAGYLQGPDTGDGLRVGALSGVLAAIPGILVFATLGTVVLGTLGLVEGGALFGAVGLLVGALLVVVVVAYAALLSALGGYVGAALLSSGSLGRL